MKLVKKRSNDGITLIEIMLILMILAFIAAFALRMFLSKTEAPNFDKTHIDILTIKNGLKFYKLDNGFYPSSAQGIEALVKKPTTPPIPQHWTQYLNALPLDQQGKPYVYANPGKYNDIDVYADSHGNHPHWWTRFKLFFSPRS